MHIIQRLAVCLIAPAWLCAAIAWAQQPSSQKVQPVSPSIKAATANPAPSMATSPAARPQQGQKIPTHGPAQPQKPQIGINPDNGKLVKKAAPAGLPPPVYSPQGVPISGMLQIEPGRVLDPATGRYYRTVPSGDGQRIVK